MFLPHRIEYVWSFSSLRLPVKTPDHSPTDTTGYGKEKQLYLKSYSNYFSTLKMAAKTWSSCK